MLHSAVIDRFEGELAVLVIAGQRDGVDVPRDRLPPGARPGQWLQIEMVEGQVVSATIDHDATAAARRRIEQKLGRLRRGEHLDGPEEG